MSDDLQHRDRCAIAGIGSTDFSKNSGRTTLTLASQAAVAALDDAGLIPSDIDGIVRCESDEVNSHDLASSLGAHNLTYWSSVDSGGAAPAGMIGNAVAAILAGFASTVLVFRSLNGRSGSRFGAATSSGSGQAVGGAGSYDEFVMPYGLLAPGPFFALLARRHMSLYGTTPEDLGGIALTCRANANANPSAQMNGRELDMEAYLQSPLLSSPLRLFDYCLETDGACAVIVTSNDRAKGLAQVPALIRAVVQATGPDPWFGSMYPFLLRRDPLEMPSVKAAEVLYRRAGFGPTEIDVAQIYDCFTITALLQLEDYGFCGRGEGGSFVSSGSIGLDGVLPMNTAGGHLSEGYIHGMNHILEGVRQIRGTSCSQVADAATVLVTSAPLGASALILRGEQ